MPENENNVPQPPVLSPKAIVQTMNESAEHAGGLSVLVNLSYQSLSGNYKDRDILIRRVIHNRNEYYLDGFALDIQAPRLIKISQITTIRDVTSGRVYANPYLFLRDRFGMEMQSMPLGHETEETTSQQPVLTDFARVIQETGPEMTILMFLVAVDGKRQPDERQRVLEYVKYRTPHLNYSDEELNEYLISLAPDEDSCTMALHYVIEKGKSIIQDFLEAMVDIISMDGTINIREKAFLARTIDLLEQEGYTFSMPV